MPELRGPRGKIGYQRDDLGFPSIDATSLEDASWARGWFHAYDRLVQVQLMLAVGGGRAMALLGDTPVGRYVDRMTRLHRFTDDLDEQVEQLTPELRPILAAYGAGFDAGANARGWPLLLRALGIAPRSWRPQDLILVCRLVGWFGLNQLVEMTTLVAGELMAANAPRRALGILLGDAATAEELAAAPIATWPAELDAFAAGMGGSNGIAIAGAESASGGALLIADPHMEIGRIPPVLYATHATHGDGDYLQGLHVPGVWYPSFGRTAKVGWTYTFGHVANVDVRIVPCRRGEMFDGTAWRPLVRRTSRVKIRSGAAETWTYWDCELGTIVGDAQRTTEIKLPCIRWNGVRETYRDANSGLALVRSKNLDEAIAANRDLSVFSLDGVLADSTGRIGHILGGRMDRRPATSRGVVPRAPDGARAPADEATRPMTIDPPSGRIVSANGRHPEPHGHAWVPAPESHARLDRLTELLAATKRPSLDDLARFVTDTCDAAAKRLLPIWAPHLPDHARATHLVAWAAAQPGTGDAHFEELGLWSALYDTTCRVLLRDLLGTPRADKLVDDYFGLLLYRYHLDDALALTRPELLDAVALRAVLYKSFPLAVTHAVPMPRLRVFKNAVFQGALSRLLDSKPVAMTGTTTTPNQISVTKVGTQEFVFGPAGRYATDMSKPGGWYCISGGASEKRFKPGYGKGLEDWSRGVFRPLGNATGKPPSST